MKKRYLFLTVIGAFMIYACEEWVELKPENSVTFENAFDTEKDIEAALFGAEQSLRVNMTSAPYSPEMRGEFSDYRQINSYDLLREEDPEAYVAQWRWNYNVIAAANVALPYINKVDMPQERRDFYRGEIAFFKAFVYLDLVRRWGDCVMIQDEVELKPIGKTTWPKVTDYAITLAKEAARLLPEWNELKESSGTSVSHRARPCKGAANAVLAHLCAWKAGCKYMAQPQDRDYDEQQLWRMVDSACSAIINRQDIYDLESTPDEVCTKTFVDGGKECIFESVFRGYWNEFDAMTESNMTNLGRYYEAYPAIPGKKIGDNKKTMYRILNSTVREMFQDYTDGSTPTTDLRRDAWFYEFEKMEQEDEEITGGYAYPYKWRYARVATDGYMAGEFINFDQNKIWWRLADIYLLRAECRARLNDRIGAIADLNKIRDRAKAKRYSESEYDGNLRYAIFKEREKELLMEGTRYFDVLRNGYYKTELYGNFRNVSDQDVVDGVFFNALEDPLFWDNSLMRQNTYWLKRQ